MEDTKELESLAANKIHLAKAIGDS